MKPDTARCERHGEEWPVGPGYCQACREEWRASHEVTDEEFALAGELVEIDARLLVAAVFDGGLYDAICSWQARKRASTDWTHQEVVDSINRLLAKGLVDGQVNWNVSRATPLGRRVTAAHLLAVIPAAERVEEAGE